MRIGIDMDDTICNTTDIVQDRVDKFASEQNLDPLDVMNDEDLKSNFYNIYVEDIYRNVEVKENAHDVLKRLKKKGNEIFILTSRNNNYSLSNETAYEITDKWLKEHDIEVDQIITSVYGKTRADMVKKYNIDLMIDNDPYNYREVILNGSKCLLFDDKENFLLKNNYVTSWLEVEEYIERSNKYEK